MANGSMGPPEATLVHRELDTKVLHHWQDHIQGVSLDALHAQQGGQT